MIFSKSARKRETEGEVIDIESKVALSRNPSNRNAILKKAQEDRKRLYAFASLASVLVLVTIANLAMWSRHETSASMSTRGIASLDTDLGKAQTLEDARALYRQMESSGRSPASVGEKPSLIDQLRFGLLEGKYALRMKEGKLYEIEFVDTEQSTDRPKYIAQPESFLKDYASLLPVSYDAVHKTSETRAPSDVHETFVLEKASAPQATVEFHHDEFGRLISMKIVPTSEKK